MWHRNQEVTNKYKKMRSMYKEYCKGERDDFFVKRKIKPYIYGYRQHLVPIPAISNKEEGLKEAVECASDYIQFSTREKRFCEIQRSVLIPEDYPSGYSHLGSYSDFVRKTYFTESGIYKKGFLKLHEIHKEEYKKLSKAAKRWFEKKVNTRWYPTGRTHEFITYAPISKISPTILIEVQQKIYVGEESIPCSYKLSRDKYLNDYLYGLGFRVNKVVHEFFPHNNIRAWSKFKKRENSQKAKQLAQKQIQDEI